MQSFIILRLLAIVVLIAMVSEANEHRPKYHKEGNGDPLDLTFLLDTSIESFPENMEVRHRFVNDCLSHMPAGSKNNARVSVITFGDLAQIQLDVKAHASLRDVRLALEGIGMRSAKTDVANALSILGSTSDKRQHKQSKKAAVIVTAGRVGDPQSAKSEAARLKKEKGIAIFVVGVGSEVDRSELESISSTGQAVLIIDSYQELATIASKLVKTISTHTQAPSAPTQATKRYPQQPRARKPRVAAPKTFTANPALVIRTRQVQTTPPFPPSSSHRPIDIVFAHPCSLGQSDTRHATEFIITIGEQLEFDGKTIRIGVTPRFCPSHAQGINVDDDSMADQLRQAMNHRLLAANYSDIVSQLRHLSDVSFSEQQMAGRSDAVKMAVVFFERKVTISEAVSLEVKRLRSIPIVLVGVLVGERDDESRRGLEELTSCEKCLLHAESYADLADQLLDRLADIVMEHRIIREVADDYDY